MHGAVTTARAGRIGHAWLSRGEIVYDPVFNRYSTVGEYYKSLEVQEITTYTLLEAARMMVAMGHSGPWEDGIPRRMGEK